MLFVFILKGSALNSGEDDWYTSNGAYHTQEMANAAAEQTGRAMANSGIAVIFEHNFPLADLDESNLDEFCKRVRILDTFAQDYDDSAPDDWPEEQRREMQREAALHHGVQGWNDWE